MAILYPAQIDTTASFPPITDGVTGINAININVFRTATIAIEHELGVNPAGIYGTVRSRFDFLDTLLNNNQTALGPAQDGYVLTWVNADGMWEAKPPIGGGGGSPSGPAGGDLSGTYPNPTVIQLQGQIALSAIPTSGQVLQATSGTAATWITPPTSLPPSGPASGDLQASYPNPTIAALQGVQFQLSSLNSGDLLSYNGSNWVNFPVANITASGPAGGDFTGTYPNPTIASLQSHALNVPSPNTGDILIWNGSAWVNDPTLSNLVNTVTTLQNQVTTLSQGQGFSIPSGSSNAANLFFDGTNITTIVT